MDNKQEKYQTAYPDTYNIVKEYARENRKKLQKDSDLLRSQWLYKQGYYVLRFTNDNVNNNIDEVRERIAEVLSQIQT